MQESLEARVRHAKARSGFWSVKVTSTIRVAKRSPRSAMG